MFPNRRARRRADAILTIMLDESPPKPEKLLCITGDPGRHPNMVPEKGVMTAALGAVTTFNRRAVSRYFRPSEG